MQRYVTFNADGTIFGFYNDEVYSVIPEAAVPITFEQWQLYSTDANKYCREGDSVRAKTQAELDAEAAARPPAPETDAEKIARLEAGNEILKSQNSEIILTLVMNDLM